MSFWEEHERREAKVEEEAQARVVAARHPQDAPSDCAECGCHGADVMFGICAGCHARWYPGN